MPPLVHPLCLGRATLILYYQVERGLPLVAKSAAVLGCWHIQWCVFCFCCVFHLFIVFRDPLFYPLRHEVVSCLLVCLPDGALQQKRHLDDLSAHENYKIARVFCSSSRYPHADPRMREHRWEMGDGDGSIPDPGTAVFSSFVITPVSF